MVCSVLFHCRLSIVVVVVHLIQTKKTRVAPEILAMKPYNEKADVYSYAIMLWEFSARRQPWITREDYDVSACFVLGFQKRLFADQSCS